MKRAIFALVVLIELLGIANGQEGTALSKVTVYSYRNYRDPSRSTINFESGARGLTTALCADADLNYGNLTVNSDNDWFQVCDPRSRIVDLGEKQWGDFKETPSSFVSKKPRKPLPLNAPYDVDTSAGSKEVSPYQQFARVRVGHMYLIRVVSGPKKTYIMFRVEDLAKKDKCTLSWEKVPPPVEDMER